MLVAVDVAGIEVERWYRTASAMPLLVAVTYTKPTCTMGSTVRTAFQTDDGCRKMD